MNEKVLAIIAVVVTAALLLGWQALRNMARGPQNNNPPKQ